MENKTFKLKKNIPGAKAGSIAEYGKSCGCYIIIIENSERLHFPASLVENNTEWFEEVLPVSEPVKEIIKVTVYPYGGNGFNGFTTPKIEKEKFPLIQKAIESVLNNDTVVEDMGRGITLSEAISKVYETKKFHVLENETYNLLVSKKYSQSEVDAIRKELEEKIEVQKAMLQLQQPTNDNTFLWTDELVLDFARFTYVDAPTMQGRYKDMEDFKKQHQSKQSTPVEQCTCKVGEPYNSIACPKHGSINATAGCAAAEPLPTKQDKDWEIVSFVSIHGEVLKLDEQKWKYRSDTSSISDINFLLKHYSIHSVKRLSDNSIWEIYKETDRGIIESFKIDSGTMYVHFKDKPLYDFCSIKYLKLPSQTPPPAHC